MIQKTQHTSPSLLIDISFQISTQWNHHIS
jgi:hypothetical protein